MQWKNSITKHPCLWSTRENSVKRSCGCRPVANRRMKHSNRKEEYLDIISTFQPKHIHFFDEASATIGEKAVKFQRYTSNVNYTINLLRLLCGIDLISSLDSHQMDFSCFIVWRCCRSSMTRWQIFAWARQLHSHGQLQMSLWPLCWTIFGRNFEWLRSAPYSPHLNTWGYCFHQIKEFLQRCQMLSSEETQIAIAEGISTISQDNSYHYFQNCW